MLAMLVMCAVLSRNNLNFQREGKGGGDGGDGGEMEAKQ